MRSKPAWLTETALADELMEKVSSSFQKPTLFATCVDHFTSNTTSRGLCSFDRSSNTTLVC
jgi:hypothetical protein